MPISYNNGDNGATSPLHSIRVLRGKLAEGSWEQVEVAKRIVELAEREVATPAEARKILSLKDRG